MIINILSIIVEFLAGILMIYILFFEVYDRHKIVKAGMSIIFLTTWFSAINTLRNVLDPTVESYVNYYMVVFGIGVITMSIGYLIERRGLKNVV